MKLSQCLRGWFAAPQRRVRRATPPDWVLASDAPATPPPEESVRGCGWFDSSHDLHSGLLITEHATPERVANEVPLGWWLDWQSSAVPSSVQTVARRC